MNERSRALARVEKDFTELTDVFHWMEEEVIQQQEKIIVAEKASDEVLNDVEQANKNLQPAIKHAESRRRNSRRVFAIALILALVVVVVVVIVKKGT